MATARVQSFPGKLGDLGDVLRLSMTKDKDGDRLIKLLCVPRNPTKSDPRRRILPSDMPEEYARLCEYCAADVRAEQSASAAMEPMSAAELNFWLVDQEINWRGLAVDRGALYDCIDVLGQVLDHYGDECRRITGFNATQLAEIKGWLSARGLHTDTLDAEFVEATLERDNLDPSVRRVLELRALTGSASVKKTYAMARMLAADDRLHDLFIHHGARTGRPTGADVQPLNLPKAGPQLALSACCSRPVIPDAASCPWCGAWQPATMMKGQWKPEFADYVLDIMAYRSLAMVEQFFGDAMLCISGCVRALFTAGPGMDLIASDYSAIEAVVAACISGETWRIEAFEADLPIYLVGASKITGTPLQSYLDYHAAHGEHHKDRQKIGKVSELACGFGGWIGSYKAFGSTEEDNVIKDQILAWRAASPAIVEMWGGQFRGLPWDRNRYAELYGVEGMFVAAVRNPNVDHDYRGFKFRYRQGYQWCWNELNREWVWRFLDKLEITLLSGRKLTYHQPRLGPSDRSDDGFRITYQTWNSNPKYGKRGWVEMETYGGRLFENIVQAVAHDIQRYGIHLLRTAGYPVVLHVYDENCVEVPAGTGSIDEVERLMAIMPPWAVVRDTGRPWPIRAAGGWRGKRYRKG